MDEIKLRDAAEQLDINRTTAAYHCRRGNWDCKKRGKLWYVDPDSVPELEKDEFLPLRDAVPHFEVARRALVNWCQEGRVKAEKRGRLWYIAKTAVHRSKLCILDKDGTVIAGLAGRPANTPSEQKVLPGVVEKLGQLRSKGWKIALASNQGGVAYGFITFGEANELMRDAAEKIGGAEWAMCSHHPQGTVEGYAVPCNCRKPEPGMLVELMARLGIPTSRTTFVGDRDTDRQAAEAAGVEFRWAGEFFGRGENDKN